MVLPVLVGQTPEPVDLKSAIARAWQNRPAVQAARLRVEQARLSRHALDAPLAPRLDLGVTSEPDLRGNDDDIVLAQPLDLFGRRRAARSVGDAQVSLAEANLRQALADVQSEVVERFADTVAAVQLAENALASLQVAERLQELTRLRVEGRIAPAVQLTRVGIEVERARQNLDLRQAQQQASLRRLSGAIGASVEPIHDDQGISNLGYDAEALPANRGDLLALAANLRVAEANAGVARLAGRPELEVSARTNAWTPGGNITGLRVQLSLPLFDRSRTRDEYRAAEKQVEVERQTLEDASRRAQAELEAVRVERAAAREQVASFQALIETSRELVQKSEIGLREGAAGMTLVDVLEATRSLREVEQGLVEARLRLAQAQAAYLRVSGHLLGGRN